MLNDRSHTSADVDLRTIAKRAMLDRGFLIQVPEEAQSQLKIEREPAFETLKLPDLTSWLWSSIDNDDSRDLDQIEYAKREKAGTRIYIGVADVDWFVPLNTALDQAAEHNTTSVYTGIMTFPMLPERLSTDLSSLNENVRRLAMVTEMLVGVDGAIIESSVYPAVVQNHAQLTYNAVAAWLEGKKDLGKPAASDITARVLEKIVHNDELADQLKLQNEVAEQLRERRHLAGALSLETTELQPILSPEGHVIDLDVRRPNRASLLIEDLMVAANQVTASLLEQKNVPSIRRVVKDPERWDRIVTLASTLGGNLPSEPDAKSLEDFLKQQRRVNPDHFHDLSLAIIKLLG